MDPRGTHLVVDLYGCKKRLEGGGEGLLAEVARLAGLTVLAKARHGFDGGGETALLLLSQSHCSIHTWPERDYVAFDLYSCRPMPPELVTQVGKLLLERLGTGSFEAQVIRRGHAAVPEKI